MTEMDELDFNIRNFESHANFKISFSIITVLVELS